MRTERTCFLIDDDIDDQEIFSLALERVNPDLRCVAVSSAHEALYQLENQSKGIPDYIFLDLNMPRMNGKECLREIKKISHLRHTPVIIYSTSSLRYDVAEALQLGAKEFITKPFSMPDLIGVLTNFFEREQVLKPASEK
jgi:CheY-like chemotaxis protein